LIAVAVVANVGTAVVVVDDGSSVVVDGDGAAENLIPEAHHPVSFSLVH
jgi:hypothetical protein